jgi:hydrogenase maturation factor
MITYRKEKFSGYNKPKRTPGKSKKFAVLAKQGDDVRLVRFGDPKMSIKKNQPARKKSYCARSGGIKGKTNKLSANYWSRKAWDC